jgi:hypothetical protein
MTGDHPVKNMGWPLGCEDVANLPGRLGYWVGPPFGGGQYHFDYRCKDTAEFSMALETFAAIQVPMSLPGSLAGADERVAAQADASALQLVVHDGPQHSSFFGRPGEGPEKLQVDWTFTVWRPESWHRTFSSPKAPFSDHPNYRQPVPLPRIDVYIGAGGSILWEEVKVPPSVRVIDRRAESATVRSVEGGLLRAAVYDMATGRPIEGAEVALARCKEVGEWEETARAATGYLGLAKIAKAPAGRHEIHVRAAGYAARQLGSYHNQGDTYHEFAVELMRAASLKGVVTDPNGKPIPGVKVTPRCILAIDGRGYACVDARPATTDEQGRFEIGSLAKGFAQLRCRGESLHQATAIFELYDVPSNDIAIVMTGTGIVRGRVIGPDGEPAAGEVHVSIQPPGRSRVGQWGGGTRCKEGGTFEFKGVPPGQYVVSAEPGLMIEGNDPNAVTVTVTAGGTVEVEIATQRARRRVNTAQDPPG